MLAFLERLPAAVWKPALLDDLRRALDARLEADPALLEDDTLVAALRDGAALEARLEAARARGQAAGTTRRLDPT